MSGDPAQAHDLEQAWRALFAGEIRDAAAVFQPASLAAGSCQAAAGLFLCAAIVGAKDSAFDLLKQRAADHNDAGLVLWQATWIAAKNGADRLLQILEALFNHLPETAPEMAPLHYAKGHLAALNGEARAAVSAFFKARAAFLSNPSWFLANGDETLTTVFLQCSHMIADAEMKRIAQGGADQGAAARSGSPPLLAVAADARYLHRFGRDFLQSLARHTDNGVEEVLVLAVDADEADAEELRRYAPGITVHVRNQDSAGWPVRKSALYASWRFLQAAECLDLYNRPILFLDIDMEITAPLSPLLDMAERHDFCCYVRPDGGPGGIARAAAVSFRPGLGTSMAALTADYLRRRFSEEAENLWFVDQVALWRSAVQIGENDPGFRWGDFTDAGPIERFFDLVEDPDTKRR